jgi:hypothetical protein
MLIKHHPSHLN